MLLYLAYAALSCLEPASVLLVEEPENGLHPARIADVMKVLRNISKDTQVLISMFSNRMTNTLSKEMVTVQAHSWKGPTLVAWAAIPVPGAVLVAVTTTIAPSVKEHARVPVRGASQGAVHPKAVAAVGVRACVGLAPVAPVAVAILKIPIITLARGANAGGVLAAGVVARAAMGVVVH